MNVSSSLQNSFTTALLQNSHNQSVQSQSMQSSFAPMGTNMASADSDGDNDNESTEQSSTKASAGFNAQSVFATLNQNGSQGVSTDQLLNALTHQSSMLSSNNNRTQSNNLQNILMDKILSSYDTTKTLTQNSKVLSA